MPMRCCLILTALLLFSVTCTPAFAGDELEEGFISLWDGKTFDNWKISENPDSWSIKDGAFVAKGPRSHLFYVGPEAPFKNFVFKVDCKTAENSNGGIYFHTKFQEEGWPRWGYESQVNNSHGDPKRTGSLYEVVNVYQQIIPDNTWWTQTITVNDKHIRVELDDTIVVDYLERPMKPFDKDDWQRYLSEGTFCFQAHDPGSTVWFKNVRVKRLD
ncbi:MAG: DUF1080 domain-containing protein [Planctomycetaceae bacterium]|nr:DUF1080 domain-containing protein [Planctomycetaceae bacterium]